MLLQFVSGFGDVHLMIFHTLEVVAICLWFAWYASIPGIYNLWCKVQDL